MPSSRQIDAVLLALAASKHGVFSTEEAARAGVSRQRVQARTDGTWATSVFRGVHILGPCGQPLALEAVATAASIAAGPGSGAAFEFAARRLGWWDRGPDLVEMVSERRPRPLIHLPLRFCHTTQEHEDDDFQEVDGLPTTLPALTICDLGARLTPWQLARVIGEAAFRGEFDQRAVEQVLDGRRGWPHTRVVRRAIELHRAGSAGSRSRSEDRFIAGVTSDWFGYGEPLVNVRGCTGFPWLEPDFVWLHEALVAEIDGRQHWDEPVAAQDEQRDQLHREAGFETLRFPSLMVWQDLPRVLQVTADALARRRHRRRA